MWHTKLIAATEITVEENSFLKHFRKFWYKSFLNMHGDKYQVLVNNNAGDRKSVSCPGQRKQIDNFFLFFLSCVSWLRLVIKAIHIWPVPIPHLSAGVWNIPVHKSEVIGPKGGKPCDGSSDPEDRNTLVVFLRFFHFARRFWNHTYRHTQTRTCY